MKARRAALRMNCCKAKQGLGWAADVRGSELCPVLDSLRFLSEKYILPTTEAVSVCPPLSQAADSSSSCCLCFRIKIEEEYAKNLSKLSLSPLAAQEEG